jgi:hypothetical protein
MNGTIHTRIPKVTVTYSCGQQNEKSGTNSCETKTQTFNFSNVSGLKFNPAKNGNLPYSLYNTTVTAGNGDVILKFNDQGFGSTIEKNSVLSIRQRGEMTVKLSKDGYHITKVGFAGSVGTIKEVSSSTRTWNARDNSTKEITFHNGTEETFISDIVVTYTSCE